MKFWLLLWALWGALLADEGYEGSHINAMLAWEPSCWHLSANAPFEEGGRLGWIGTFDYCDRYEGKSRFLRESVALGGGLIYAHGGLFRSGLFASAILLAEQSDLYEVNTLAKGVSYGSVSAFLAGYQWHFCSGYIVSLSLGFTHRKPWRRFVDDHGARSRDALERMLEREETQWRPILALGWRF